MPRKPREKSSINTYHIVIKGLDRQLLFEEPDDYNKYLHILEFFKSKYEFDLYAYCLMSNHVHLLIHINNIPLETIFRHINTTYATWFNMKYNRQGHLQQNRYYSEPLETLESIKNVLRYIHQNPMKAGLEMYTGEKYPWNSFHAYKTDDFSFVDGHTIISYFGNKISFLNLHIQETNIEFLDIKNITKRLPDDVAKKIINEICHCSTATDFQKLSILERNHYIKLLHAHNLSARQINRLTGVSRGVIERILFPPKDRDCD